VDADHSGAVSAEELSEWSGSLPRTQMKVEFAEASQRAVSSKGWQALFQIYDTDGSGALDVSEFIVAVRKDCDINEWVVPDAELSQMFSYAATDEELSPGAFSALLASDSLAQDMVFDVFYEAMFQLVDLWTATRDERDYVGFLERLFSRITSRVAKVSVITRTSHCASLWEVRVITITSRVAKGDGSGGGGFQLREITQSEQRSTGRVLYELADIAGIATFANEAGEIAMPGVSLVVPGGAPSRHSPSPPAVSRLIQDEGEAARRIQARERGRRARAAAEREQQAAGKVQVKSLIRLPCSHTILAHTPPLLTRHLNCSHTTFAHTAPLFASKNISTVVVYPPMSRGHTALRAAFSMSCSVRSLIPPYNLPNNNKAK
jgi:hypothetical protein